MTQIQFLDKTNLVKLPSLTAGDPNEFLSEGDEGEAISLSFKNIIEKQNVEFDTNETMSLKQTDLTKIPNSKDLDFKGIKTESFENKSSPVLNKVNLSLDQKKGDHLLNHKTEVSPEQAKISPLINKVLKAVVRDDDLIKDFIKDTTSQKENISKTIPLNSTEKIPSQNKSSVPEFNQKDIQFIKPVLQEDLKITKSSISFYKETKDDFNPLKQIPPQEMENKDLSLLKDIYKVGDKVKSDPTNLKENNVLEKNSPLHLNQETLKKEFPLALEKQIQKEAPLSFKETQYIVKKNPLEVSDHKDLKTEELVPQTFNDQKPHVENKKSNLKKEERAPLSFKETQYIVKKNPIEISDHKDLKINMHKDFEKSPRLKEKELHNSILKIKESISEIDKQYVGKEKTGIINKENVKEVLKNKDNCLRKDVLSDNQNMNKVVNPITSNAQLNSLPIMVPIQEMIILPQEYKEINIPLSDEITIMVRADQNVKDENQKAHSTPFIENDDQENLSILTSDEESLIHDFVFKNSLQGNRKTETIFTEIDIKQWRPQGGGHPFLTPIFPLKNIRAENVFDFQDKIKESFDKIEHLLEGSKPIRVIDNEEQKNLFEQEQPIIFNSQIPQKSIFDGKENVQLQTSFLSQSSASFALIDSLKEQLQKFQKNSDHKLTVQMRDSGRDLTIVFHMNEKKGIHVTFRTKDKDWKTLLQNNKQKIQESLDETHQNVDIRYIGE